MRWHTLLVTSYCAMVAYASSASAMPHEHSPRSSLSPEWGKQLYQQLVAEKMLPAENKYSVFSVSVLALINATMDVLDARPHFIGGEGMRPWMKAVEQHFNAAKDPVNIFNVGYIAHSQLPSGHTKPLLVDATWSLTDAQFQPIAADGYLFSLTTLSQHVLKLSVAFFSDSKLAERVSERLWWSTGGISSADIQCLSRVFQDSGNLASRRLSLRQDACMALQQLSAAVASFNKHHQNALKVINDPSLQYGYVEGPVADLELFKDWLKEQRSFSGPPYCMSAKDDFYAPEPTEHRLVFSLWAPGTFSKQCCTDALEQ